MKLNSIFADPSFLYKLRPLLFIPPAIILVLWVNKSSTAFLSFVFLCGYTLVLYWLWTMRSDVPDLFEEREHDLEALYQLTAALNGAADVEGVQALLLDTAVDRLGYRQAVVGLVDAQSGLLTSWLSRTRSQQHTQPLAHTAQILFEATPKGPHFVTSEDKELKQWLQANFGFEGALAVPLLWGLHLMGILIVEAAVMPDSLRQRTLSGLARQTAVAIGMMTTRLRRAKESAIQEERARIAMDIHDSVSQSLFGLTYTLDGVLKLLPHQPEQARPELERVLHTAEAVRQELRRSIHDMWPHELTAAQFECDLCHYARDVLQAVELSLLFDIRGDFGTLAPSVRRTLYRISQESLTNVIHHAAATEVRVCLDIYADSARLAVRDNGRGFEPAVALAQSRQPEHFGLQGMHERVRSLGGTYDIFSKPGAGTSIIVDLPVRGR